MSFETDARETDAARVASSRILARGETTYEGKMETTWRAASIALDTSRPPRRDGSPSLGARLGEHRLRLGAELGFRAGDDSEHVGRVANRGDGAGGI